MVFDFSESADKKEEKAVIFDNVDSEKDNELKTVNNNEGEINVKVPKIRKRKINSHLHDFREEETNEKEDISIFDASVKEDVVRNKEDVSYDAVEEEKEELHDVEDVSADEIKENIEEEKEDVSYKITEEEVYDRDEESEEVSAFVDEVKKSVEDKKEDFVEEDIKEEATEKIEEKSESSENSDEEGLDEEDKKMEEDDNFSIGVLFLILVGCLLLGIGLGYFLYRLALNSSAVIRVITWLK